MFDKKSLGKILFAIFVVAGSFIVVTSSKKNNIIASRDDLKHIGCEVCEKMVGILKSEIDEMKPYKPRKDLMEVQVLEPIETVCNPNNATGEWIRRQDITEVTADGGTFLKLTEPGGIGKCGVECVTITKSCHDLLNEELDEYELAQAFITKRHFSLHDFQFKVCNSMSKRCKKPAAPLSPKYNRVDSPFVLITLEQLEQEKALENSKPDGKSAAAKMFGKDYAEKVKEEVREATDEDKDGSLNASEGGASTSSSSSAENKTEL